MSYPLSDEQREDAISIFSQLSQGSAESALRRYFFDKMKEEIANRSPEQVKRLEVERNLRAA